MIIFLFNWAAKMNAEKEELYGENLEKEMCL